MGNRLRALARPASLREQSASQVLGPETCMLCDAREPARADFLAFVECKEVIAPALARENAMRACLPLERPADGPEPAQDPSCLCCLPSSQTRDRALRREEARHRRFDLRSHAAPGRRHAPSLRPRCSRKLERRGAPAPRRPSARPPRARLQFSACGPSAVSAVFRRQIGKRMRRFPVSGNRRPRDCTYALAFTFAAYPAAASIRAEHHSVSDAWRRLS